MAPESVNDNEYRSEADVWALGCAVVEMFIGETAWSFKEGSHFMSLLIRMVSERNFRGFPRTCRDKEETFCQSALLKIPRRDGPLRCF